MPAKKSISNLINHVVYLLDSSGSMSRNQSAVVKVFDNQIKSLAARSKETDQETRVSVYLFNNGLDCLIYEKDVLRLPSLAGLYNPSGGTAMIDGAMKSIRELKQIPQMRGDHSFLFYVVTDGEENQSHSFDSAELSKEIQGLEENWTLGCLVPDTHGESEAKRFGFPAGNIAIWNPNKMESAEKEISRTTESFFKGRAVGIRGTRELFKVDVNLSTTQIKNNLDALPKSKYILVQAKKDEVIKEMATKAAGSYVVGNSYYELVKTEELQSYKQICIRDRVADKVFVGDEARTLIGLPRTNIKVKPGNFKQYDIFCQSSSHNRKIPTGSKLLVLL